MSIAFIDIETTGLDFVKNEVIEIAVVLADPITERIIEEHQFFIEAKKGVDEEAARVNGYFVGKWKNKAQDSHEVARKLNTILKNVDEIFAHNAAFDRSFISAFMSNNGIDKENQPKYFLDTATIAYLFKRTGYFTKVSLNHCLDKLNLTNLRSDKHSALEDARLLKEVFFKLIKKVEIKWNN